MGAALNRERVGVGRCREIYPKVPSGAQGLSYRDDGWKCRCRCTHCCREQCNISAHNMRVAEDVGTFQYLYQSTSLVYGLRFPSFAKKLL